MLRLAVALENPAISETPRETLTKRIFGLSSEVHTRRMLHDINLPMKPITYITGFSGSGKSSLLSQLQKEFQGKAISEVSFSPEKTVIENFEGEVGTAIQWLSRFGLGEARVLTTPAAVLSVGQKERLRLALALWKKPEVLILDEFLSSLDRLTARTIAYQFQRVVRKMGTICFLATAHSDLEDALFPDTVVDLDFEGEYRLRSHSTVGELAESHEVEVSEGTIEDYEKLKRFHYMDAHGSDLSVEDVVSVRKATFRGQLVGVRVFTKLFPSRYETMRLFKVLNETAVLSSRVVVHPVFRGLGISKKMDLSAENQKRFRKIFTHSALARYFPFDGAGGYRTLEHVSEKATPDQLALEKQLFEKGATAVTLNNPLLSQKLWAGLSMGDQNEIRKQVVAILSDYDARYVLYLCQELKISVPPEASVRLISFFKGLLDRLPEQHMPRLLSEALHFPMLGLVKDL